MEQGVVEQRGVAKGVAELGLQQPALLRVDGRDGGAGGWIRRRPRQPLPEVAQGHGTQSTALKHRVTLCPPNPKELLRAYSTCLATASPGM